MNIGKKEGGNKMKLTEAIEVIKVNRPILGRISDEMMDAIDTILSSKTTANKTALDDRLDEKSIEVSDNQEYLSSKKDDITDAEIHKV